MDFSGLSEAKARELLDEYGKNELKREKEPGLMKKFLSQLADPLIGILLAAAVISLALHEVNDAIIILTVIFLNSLIGMIQEGKARRALEGLEKLTAPHALVIRDGSEKRIPASLLVPGDLVILEAGAFVPADARILKSVNLKCDEASMSGESEPVEKQEGECAWMSTSVVYGRGAARVCATGMDTRIGRIAKMAQKQGTEQTPLQKRLGSLGIMLGVLTVILCAALFVMALIQKRSAPAMLLTAISLAVAAVPEGLPAIVTIVFALSVSGLVKVNAIVRRLPCVETLGCVSTVCTDKTGTLTQNQMTVKCMWTYGGVYRAKDMDKMQDKKLLEAFLLCSDARQANGQRLGDPTELALLDFGRLAGADVPALLKSQVRIAEIPFSSKSKKMVTLHKNGTRCILYMKGAPEAVLASCSTYYDEGREKTLDASARRRILEAEKGMSTQALRVLAAAYRNTDRLTQEGLTFLGFAGMIDPVRPGVCQAAADLRNAHVRIIMITGDNKDTAAAIGREIGLGAECVSGSVLDAMSDEKLCEQINKTDIFARVSPEHKCRIVKALKQNNEVVAMTGDGTNDAPALCMADVGIAMGSGTDVARSAGDFVLADDNFASIRDAIAEGRSIYKNIKKSLVFLLSSNFGEVMTMFAAVACGLDSPLKPAHILWINLITDSLPALALGCDENDKNYLMSQPPRSPNESIFAHGGLALTVIYGAVISCVSMSAFLFLPVKLLVNTGQALTIANILAAFDVQDVLLRSQTYAFTVLGLSQLFHAVGMRDIHVSVFRQKHNNRLMYAAVFLGIVLQLLVTECLTGIFQTAKLSLPEWGFLLIFSAVPLLVHELLALISFPNSLATAQRKCYNTP